MQRAYPSHCTRPHASTASKVAGQLLPRPPASLTSFDCSCSCPWDALLATTGAFVVDDMSALTPQPALARTEMQHVRLASTWRAQPPC